MPNGWRLNWQTLKLGWPEFVNYPNLCTLRSCLEFCKIPMPFILWCNKKGKHSTNQGWHTALAKGTKSYKITKFPPECITFLRLFFLCHSPVKDWIGSNRSVCQRVVSPTVISQTSLRSVCKRVEVSSQTLRSQFATVISQGTQRQFYNICSEDHLRSRIFGTFVVKCLACLPASPRIFEHLKNGIIADF